MGLTWSMYDVHGAHVLELAGQLTRMTVLLLEPQLAKLLTRTGSILVVDLTKVDACDRAGIAMLEAGHRAATVAGVELRLAAPSAPAGRVLHSAGLLTVLPVFDSVDAAARGDALGLLPRRPSGRG
jgi:anti-sigma B factor antagonist